MTTTPKCPSEERLVALLKGSLSLEEQEQLARHLEQCPACHRALEVLAGDDAWVKHCSTAPSPDTDALRRVVEELKARPTTEAASIEPPAVDFLNPPDKPGYLGKFGPYDIVDTVAAGGMGIVLKGHDPALNRIVAIKVLAPALAANAAARQRFLREARAAAAVAHDHVVTIHAVDEASNLPYLVMQFVPGRSLEARIHATAPLSIEEILRIGRQIALGLAAAHAQGLIHRDIKPGNILLENGIERVKITDFGLARAVDDSGLTQSGCITGTPEFMAPEQARGDPIDHRADLFSLGCVLYAMATGRSPFHGGSVLAVLRKVCDTEPPPVHEVNSRLPRWLSDIVASLMAKAPAERFQSAAEVAAVLEQHLARVARGQHGEAPAGVSTVRVPARAERRRGRRWRAAALLTASAAVGLFVSNQLGWISFHGSGPVPPVITNTSTSVVFPKNAIVLLPKFRGAPVRTFDDLAEAIDTAVAEDTIELRFNATLELQPIRIRRPVTLRAGEGFQPVLASASDSDPLIHAQVPLVLEGIELRSRAANTGPSQRAPPWRGPGRPRPELPDGQAFNPDAPPWLIFVVRGPLLLAHCRVTGGGSENRKAIAVADADQFIVWHSEFYDAIGSQGGPALAFTQDRAMSSRTDPARMFLHNCVHHGGAAVLVSPTPERPAIVELSHNTFGGRGVLRLARPGAANLLVRASSNHFASTLLVQVESGPLKRRPAGMQWSDQHNLFNAGLFLRLEEIGAPLGVAKSLAEWEQIWGQTNTDSRVLPSALTRHLSQIVEAGRKLTPLDFSPDPENRDYGAAVDQVGPGAAYDRWRESGEYAAWIALVGQSTARSAQRGPLPR